MGESRAGRAHPPRAVSLESMRRIAAVVLVDSRGWLLLQERDEHARVDPERWGLVGGGVEAGESDAEAALRELAEETGLSEVTLEQVASYLHDCGGCAEAHPTGLFLALTDLTDADVRCHEGRQIVFVDPRTVADLDWTSGLAAALPRVLGSASYVERFGAVDSREFAGVLLVDRSGRLLLQERDEHAPIDPERWGVCGGHLEPGERPEVGARRELAEETALDLPGDALAPFATIEVYHPHYGSVDRLHLFAAGVDLADADIECREGRRIVFVDPARARTLPLTMSASMAVPQFLASADYQRLLSRP